MVVFRELQGISCSAHITYHLQDSGSLGHPHWSPAHQAQQASGSCRGLFFQKAQPPPFAPTMSVLSETFRGRPMRCLLV